MMELSTREMGKAHLTEQNNISAKGTKGRLTTGMLVGLCSVLWGLSFYATKVALNAGITEMELLALRWSIAAIVFVFLSLTGIVNVDFKGKHIRSAVYVAMFQPCFYSIFETWGIGLTTTSESSLLIATIPLMVLVTGKVLYKRSFSRRTGFAIILALAGVSTCIVFSDGFSFEGKYFGYLIVMVAVLLGSLYCHASANASLKFTAMEMTLVMAISGGIFFDGLNLTLGGRFIGALTQTGSLKVIGAVLFLGVCCSCICYIIFNYVLGKMNTATASNMIANSTTAVGVISGVVLAKDPFGWYTVVGLGMTISGIWLASREEPMDPAEVIH
ncbi:MAG: DMT family transporter [Clostridiales bacterium]|nr:DMT family transporter [Clostridiales bacterium]